MNRMLIILGFIIIVVGGLLYILLPYSITKTDRIEMQTGANGAEYITNTTTTTTGNNPIGTVMMFVGFTVVVVGLLYRSEVAKAQEMKQENQ